MVPWKKKADAAERREVIAEPVRLSLYDVLQTNLRIAKRANYIHRLVYIGGHKFSGTPTVADAFEANYKLTNTGHSTEYLSGVVLHYPTHFCCIAEGSEDVLHKHLALLFEHESENLDNVRLLSAVHHIKSRFLNEWMSYFGRPQERVEEIDPESDLENSMRYVQECCERLYGFANAFVTHQMRLKALVSKQGADEEENEGVDSLPEKRRSRSLVERDLYSQYIPELKLLDFLIHCKYLKTLKQYHHYYEYVGQSRDYNLKTWPAPKNLTPYDVFDEIYDPISDLPSKEQSSKASTVTEDEESEMKEAPAN